MTACPLDGSVRTIAYRDRYATWWHCPWCGQDTEEPHPSPTNDLQRAYDRRSHP